VIPARFRLPRRAASLAPAMLLAIVAFVALLAPPRPVRANAPVWQYEIFGRNDTCIADHWTKLTWQRTWQSGATYTDAASTCAALGPSWRVPSMKELLTLVDEQVHDEYEAGQNVSKAIDANAFPHTPVALPFWTSSRVAGDATRAWSVSFSDGATSKTSLGVSLNVRCVQVTPASPPPYCQ
jgi:hypothetical protein